MRYASFYLFVTHFDIDLKLIHFETFNTFISLLWSLAWWAGCWFHWTSPKEWNHQISYGNSIDNVWFFISRKEWPNYLRSVTTTTSLTATTTTATTTSATVGTQSTNNLWTAPAANKTKSTHSKYTNAAITTATATTKLLP